MSDALPSFWRIILLGRCPACGRGAVFCGLLSMRERCAVCGLHFAAREQGDGPAFFGIVIIGTLATIGAAVTEIIYEPPYWLHALIWPLFILVGSLVCLRLAKAGLLAIQYAAKPNDFR